MSARSLPGTRLLANRPFVNWLLVSLAFGHSLGTIEVSALAISDRLNGGSFEAAMLIAVLAVASMIGGVCYASLGTRNHQQQVRYTTVFLVVMAVTVLSISLLDTWILTGLAFFVLGGVVAPLSILRQQATENETPSAQRSEAFATLFASNAVGFAVAGLLLAILPLTAMIAIGCATPLLALTAGRWLLADRDTTT